jgi:ariadne-1
MWCAKGCEYVTNKLPSFEPSKPVKCKCGASTCSKCLKYSHRPVTCKIAVEWEMKNSSESENMNWILANTKACPKCHKQVERSSGCNQMGNHGACCGHLWCWECMGDWADHVEKHGGWYKCNIAANPDADLKKKIDSAKKGSEELQRYSAAFEKFNNNELSEKHAFRMLDTMDERIIALHASKGVPASES